MSTHRMTFTIANDIDHGGLVAVLSFGGEEWGEIFLDPHSDTLKLELIPGRRGDSPILDLSDVEEILDEAQRRLLEEKARQSQVWDAEEQWETDI